MFSRARVLTAAAVVAIVSTGTAQSGSLEDALSVARVAYDKKDYGIAIETILKGDPSVRDTRSRKLLAASHHGRGLQRYQANKLDLSRRDFVAANRYTPGVESILQSLGVITYRLKRYSDARGYMRSVLKLNEKNATALSVLGKIAASHDNVQSASKYFDRASKSNPKRKDLGRLATKYGKEAKVESKFVSRQSGNFKVFFERGKTVGVERAVKTVVGDLEQVYREVSQALGGRVSRKVMVMIYNRDQYNKVNSSHAWARAYYDGKLRIAVDGWPRGRSQLRSDLRHELVHAFLHEVYPSTPLWVHEGYAQLLDGTHAGMAKSRFKDGTLKQLPMKTFLGNFAGSRSQQVVESGYAQSLVLVNYLIKKGGNRKFRQLLAEFRRGVDAKRAVKIHYRKNVEQLLADALR